MLGLTSILLIIIKYYTILFPLKRIKIYFTLLKKRFNGITYLERFQTKKSTLRKLKLVNKAY